MSKDKRPQGKPQSSPKGKQKPLKESWIGERQGDFEQLKRGAEIPPRPPKKKKE